MEHDSEDGPHTGAATVVTGGDEPGESLESHIVAVGDELLASMRIVLDSVERTGQGPQALARTLGIDKVLASRVLKAMRSRDPMTATHCMPGPDPLRRVVKAAAKRGVGGGAVADATRAIDKFEVLIRDRIGDRSLLDAILSSWVPEARREFELRRKQSAFKAISQLKGVQAESIVATAVVSPSATDAKLLDVVWLNGLAAVHRVRPGVGVKISTRRMAGGTVERRRPRSLDGNPVEDLEGLMLREFCSDPAPAMNVHQAGEAVHYTLADDGFGPHAAVDLFFAEANLAELPRYVEPGSGRKSYFFAEVATPARMLQFDMFVHESLYPGPEPALRIYDTSFEGVASVNDRARDIDRLDLLETIEPLGSGLSRFRSGGVPRYAELVRHVFERIGRDGAGYRGYRCRIDYPMHGSQVTMVFEPEVGAHG